MSPKNKKILIWSVIAVVLCIIVLIVLLPGPSKVQKVRIGYIEHISGLPFFVAMEKGYFKEEGVEVEFINTGFNEFMQALLTDRVDLITSTSFPQIFGIESEKSGTLRFFHASGEEIDGELIYGIVVRSDSNISSIEELKGKKIGTAHGFTTVNLKLILKKAGINPDIDITIMEMSGDVAMNALVSHSVDALLLDQPQLSVCLEKGYGKLLIKNPRARYITNPYWSGAGAISSKFLNEHPDLLKKVFRAADRGLDFVRTNEEEAKVLFVKYARLTPDIAKKTGFYFMAKTTDPVDMEKIQLVADLMLEYGLIKNKVNVSQVYLPFDKVK